MKTMKKIMVLLLSILMVIGTTMVTSFAEGDTFTITINKDASDKAAHTYGAYQMFKGDLTVKDNNTILSNIQWGDNLNSATLITELNKIQGITLAANATATEVAKAISDKNYAADSDGAKALAEAVNKAVTGDPKGTAAVAADAKSGVISGLTAGYYLVKDTAAVTGEGASTKYILQVVKNVEVTEKASVPTVEKTVGTENKKVADYNIGDDVPYTITGTLPSEFAKFETYKKYTFTDTMTDGLTPPAANAVTVKIGEDDITSLFDVTVSGQVLTVSLKSGVDLKTATHGSNNTKFAANDRIVVSYSAKLNDNAVIGGTGNINTVNLQFSNNPNSDGDGDTGTTPDDKTVVFTYKIVADKVEPTSDAAIDKTAYDALTDGQKKEYVKIGDKYQKVTPLAGAGFTLYKADGTTVVKEIAAGTTTSFVFNGVDAGTYVLKETTVPEGYNKVADITITVTATYDESKKPPEITNLTCTPASFVATATTGTVEGKILNEKGSELPSTGGMGTTILYIIGGALVVICGIMLVAKKRTGK